MTIYNRQIAYNPDNTVTLIENERTKKVPNDANLEAEIAAFFTPDDPEEPAPEPEPEPGTDGQ